MVAITIKELTIRENMLTIIRSGEQLIICAEPQNRLNAVSAFLPNQPCIRAQPRMDRAKTTENPGPMVTAIRGQAAGWESHADIGNTHRNDSTYHPDSRQLS